MSTTQETFALRAQTRKICSILLIGLGWCLWLWTIYASLKLRPANDDYWIIAESGASFADQALFWWTTWSGNIVGTFSNYVFVGYPGVNFPWPFVSAFAFTIAGFSVAGAILLMLRRVAHVGQLTLKQAFLLLPPLSVMWTAYLWLGTGSPDSERSRLVYGMTHWQNLNAAYVIISCLVVAILASYLTWSRAKSPRGLILGGTIGLVIGFSGEVLGATVVAALILGSLVRLSFIEGTSMRASQPALVVSLGTVAGLLASLSSPGSRARSEWISSYHPDSVLSIASPGSVALQTMMDLKDAVFCWGSGLTLVTTLGITVLLMRSPQSQVIVRVFRLAGILFVIAVLHAGVNSAAELYAGYGFWHRSTLQWLIFASVAILGVGGGLTLARRANSDALVVVATSLLVSSLAIFAAVTSMYQSATERLSEWDKGPAPIPGVFDDLMGPQPWIDRSWLRVTKLRDAPDRSGD